MSRPAVLLELTTYLLSQTARVAKSDLDARLARRGMRLRHMAVLASLADGRSSGQLELTRRLNLDPSDVTATLDDLEVAGSVRRDVDPADRRRRIVVLTTGGRRTLRELRGAADQVADELFAPLSVTRRRQLHADLLTVLARIDARPTS